MHNEETVEEALEFLRAGKNPSQVAKIMGISRTTVRYWNDNHVKQSIPRKKPFLAYDRSTWSEDELKAYSFILGVYLGDGYIDKIKELKNGRSVYRLRLFQDPKYIKDIVEWQEKLGVIFCNNKISLNKGHNGTTFVCLYNSYLPEVFPQYGAGRKHDRTIKLTEWQKEITTKYPNDFIKGLFKSDGCYSIPTTKNGPWGPFYSFCNMSDEILKILQEHLLLINIKVNYTSPKGKGRPGRLNVYTKADVDLLYSFIGAKS